MRRLTSKHDSGVEAICTRDVHFAWTSHFESALDVAGAGRWCRRESNRSSGVVLLAGLLLAACGPGSELVAVDLVYKQDARGDAVKVVSAIHVDSGGAPWQATHAARVSASVAPDDVLALSYCQLVDGGPRGTSFTDFLGYDLGSVRVDGAAGAIALERRRLDVGEGFAFRSEVDVAQISYAPGREYIVRGEGSDEAPPFTANVNAPPDFRVETIGTATAGSGRIPIQRSRDLQITWSPGSEDAGMFIVLASPSHGLVCRVPDKGEFTVRKRHLSKMPVGHADIVLERYYQSDFDTGYAPDSRIKSGRARYSVQRLYQADLY